MRKKRLGGPKMARKADFCAKRAKTILKTPQKRTVNFIKYTNIRLRYRKWKFYAENAQIQAIIHLFCKKIFFIAFVENRTLNLCKMSIVVKNDNI